MRKYFVKAINYFDERFGHRWADADLAMQIRRTQKKARLYPTIRVTVHDAPDPRAGESLVEVDCVLGAAAYLGKYHGFMSGLTFRLGAIFGALGKFQFGKLGALLGGQKLDGSQAM